MLLLWIKCLVLSLYYIVPLIQGVQLLRGVNGLQGEAKKERVVFFSMYFMLQAFLTLIEWYLYLYL